MSEYFENFEFLQMIEEGIVITREQIFNQYELGDDEIDSAVREKQLSKPVKKFNAEYFLTEEIELFLSNLGHDETQLA